LNLPTLRFLTCGSVDDGKSTLIGRLLWESRQVFDDQARALERDSVRWGTQGQELDFALLLDGLEAEREQSITIDVAYRFFSTPRRRFVVADAPGHEQYTRNMATGASTAELAVLVVNAGKGLLTQTYRHARIASMMGIHHLVLAVNKMDLVDWDQAVFARIVEGMEPLQNELGFSSFQPIPLSALRGDFVTRRGENAPWYRGPALLDLLEQIDVAPPGQDEEFRISVQWVNRPHPDFRGYCGRVTSGVVRPGDGVRILPAGTESRIRSIYLGSEECNRASAGQSVTLCLEDEIDVTRGCVIASVVHPPEVSDQFEARVLSLSGHPLFAGRSYLFQLQTAQAAATITAIKYKTDLQSGMRLATHELRQNDIGVVNLSLDRAVPFEPYERQRLMGAFILIDRLYNQTVGAGMIGFALRRAANIHWQALDVNKNARAGQKAQRPLCVWFTGLSGSGKSTVANLLEKRLYSQGRHTYALDGDNVRHGLNRDLGFTEADRVENIRRVTEVARLMVDAGLIVLVSFISPYRSERELARSRFAQDEFLEVFVDTPMEECERRDPKGLYAKARRGELSNFTGIDSTYEPPEAPELRLDTMLSSAEECVDSILREMEMRFAQPDQPRIEEKPL
jgi:bifunctional enzyme CysN/CysC